MNENKKGAPPDLQELRDRIGACDREILDLLKKRLDIAAELTRIKLERALPFRDTAREDQVLEGVRSLAAARGLDPHEVEKLYRIVLEMSVARQQAHLRSLDDVPLRVAYQGTEGAYSHLAAQKRYAGRPGGVLLSGFGGFREVVEAVREGRADYGLLPIENTTAGSINETYDLLAEGGVKITGEGILRVVHCLLGIPGSREEDVRTILSHPQAIAQCRTFLDRLKVRLVPEYDTAGAARKVRETGDPATAAIASEEAGLLYGLTILRSAINTEPTNLTRFVEIARDSESCPSGTPIKTSLILELPHRSGALVAALEVFGKHAINLLKLESRPLPGRPFEYRFYVDVDGHASTPPLSDALSALVDRGNRVRLLGSYPVS